MREGHVVVVGNVSAEMGNLFRRHGSWIVLQAFAYALLRRLVRAKSNRVSDLNNHMRRDIGLPAIDAEVGDLLKVLLDQRGLSG